MFCDTFFKLARLPNLDDTKFILPEFESKWKSMSSPFVLADLSLRCAQRSFCWFCHAAAHFNGFRHFICKQGTAQHGGIGN